MTIGIFVFGSNLAGHHGAGAALAAYNDHQARRGIGEGPTGQAYAIPTKDRELRPLPRVVIHRHVRKFIEYARQHPALHFVVTRVGCGLAGYTDADIAPFFVDAPDNCQLPDGWRTLARAMPEGGELFDV